MAELKWEGNKEVLMYFAQKALEGTKRCTSYRDTMRRFSEWDWQRLSCNKKINANCIAFLCYPNAGKGQTGFVSDNNSIKLVVRVD